MSSRVFCIAAALGLIAVASCVENEPTSITSVQASRIAETASARGGISDVIPEPTLQPRFTVRLTASGSMGVGQPVKVIAHIRGVVPTQAVMVRMIAPEYQTAATAGWDHPFRVRPHVRIAAMDSAQISLGAHETVTRDVTLVFPTAGVYRVVASVRQISNESPLAAGQALSDAADDDIWLRIDTAGGKILDGRPSDGRIGPRRTPGQQGRGDVSARPSAVVSDAGPMRVDPYDCGDPNRMCVWAGYLDNDSSAYIPSAAGIYLELWDEYSGQQEWAGSLGGVDIDGHLSVDCVATDNEQGRISATAPTLSDVKLVDGNGSEILEGGQTYFYKTDCGATLFVGPYSDEQGHVRDKYQNEIIPLSRALFGQSRSKIPVALAYDTLKLGQYYQASDYILIHGGVIWGESGNYVMAHEYGHALWAGLGRSNFPGNCVSTDYFKPQPYPCAWSEGWASFHGFWVGRAAGNTYMVGYTEANSAWGLAASYGDPGTAPWVVAAMLWDIADSTNVGESFDSTNYGGSWVLARVNSCLVYPAEPYLDYHVWRPDAAAACLEGQVDSLLYSSPHFVLRLGDVQSVYPGTSPPNDPNWQAHVLQVWLHDLYNQ